MPQPCRAAQRAQNGGVVTKWSKMPPTVEKKISPVVRTDGAAAMVESIVGCKWSLVVLQLVQRGVNRPGAMERAVPGLTAKVLNERLRKLLRFGICEKKVFPVLPPHVEYRLTPFGKKFTRLLRAVERLQRDLEKASSSVPGSRVRAAPRA
jgi:DNA-binding HxlR family transcriptional regulator